jgi:hypothetical protein
MTLRLHIAMTAALALSSTAPFANESNISLPQLITACGQNDACSNQTTGEGTLFILRHAQRTQNLLCQDNGTCVTILAKGQRVRVQDSLAKISAR